MVKKSKLLSALDAHKGRDYDAEKRKKQVKAAEKRKRKRVEDHDPDLADEFAIVEGKSQSEPLVIVDANATAEKDVNQQQDGEFSGFSASDDEDQKEDTRQKSPSPSGSASSASSIPVSDLSSTHSDTLIPHHRLTINNSAALTASTKRIRLSYPHPKTPFSKTHSLISPLNPQVPDPHDDLTRELEFYKLAASAATQARHLLLHETSPTTPFTRPPDYFAEMVKSDSHMHKIQEKHRRDAADKKAAAEARRQRDLKKFGKAVQVAKEQERAKEKRQTLERIKEVKRKRRGNDPGLVRETEEDLFDVGVEDGNGDGDQRRGGGNNAKFKRQKRDAKFGFGGKKRFAKSGTAESTADARDFPSARRMKAGGGRGGRGGGGAARGGGGGKTKRLGKSRRAKAR